MIKELDREFKQIIEEGDSENNSDSSENSSDNSEDDITL